VSLCCKGDKYGEEYDTVALCCKGGKYGEDMIQWHFVV
jgi:hypothetical protein